MNSVFQNSFARVSVPRVQEADSGAPSICVDPVTPEMVHVRTCHVGQLNGRSAGRVTQADYEQAKRELYRERDLGRQKCL